MITADSFDGAHEPMRAIRDLISMCEAYRDIDPQDNAIIERAQAGFTTLRKLLGDDRPAEEIADGRMVEPQMRKEPDLLDALRLTAGALNCIALKHTAGDKHVVTFTGAWARFGSRTIGSILDHADAALYPIVVGA